MHAMWHNMFVLGLPILEKILRPILVYLFLIVGLRLSGKRELAQLNPFDLVVLLSLSNTVQNAIIGDDNTFIGGVIGAVTLLVTNYLVVRFLFRHRRLDQLIEGRPSFLMKEGHVNRRELARELMTQSELEVVVRRQGFDGLHEVDEVMLEPGGGFVITPKRPRDHEQVMTKLREIEAELKALRPLSS